MRRYHVALDTTAQLGEIDGGHITDVNGLIRGQALDLRFTELRQFVQHVVQFHTGSARQEH